MSTATAVADARIAGPADNARLLALTAACPMQGDLTLCVERAPDFFALNRLEGDAWWVGVVDAPGGTAAGCVAAARRAVWLHGAPAPSMYVSDLKVHPHHRRTGVADRLIAFLRDTCHASGGRDVPTLLTVLAGNRRMARYATGPRGLPAFVPFATVRSHAIPLLSRRVPRDVSGLHVGEATERDRPEMADLWRRLAGARQFVPDFDADALARWVTAAPGLALGDYLLARRGGRLVGFLAVWDQRAFKQLRVLCYSRRLAVARHLINTVGRLAGAHPLPPAGAPLATASIVHLCVPPDAPAVLRALLRAAYRRLVGGDVQFLNVGLDRRDPLTAALRGFLAQPTDVAACITTPAGRYAGPRLDDRPLYYDIALV